MKATLIRLALAACVGVVVTLVCMLIGILLMEIKVSPATVIGGFLKTYAVAFGIISFIWYFLTGKPTPIA